MFKFLSKFFSREYPVGLLAPDPIDIRDYQLAELQEAVDLPEEFDLRSQMTPISSQFYGTCTSHAVDGVKEFQEKEDLSQRFIYYNTKKISGLWNIQGDYLRNALKAVCNYGVCLEKTFPDSAVPVLSAYDNPVLRHN